ncbi:MAG: MBL fold metallo-hydrolase [Beijerinckiaceae bacterium]|nr:MAG: MBL fold metallo-hydrolase [Beijerinckiaceae bacterium]
MTSDASTGDIVFDRSPVGPPSKLVSLTDGVRRMVADNPGPMTFTGTCTYVIGHGDVAVIDPGPDLPQHVAALLESLGNERVSHILVTHTHRDHCGAAAALKVATGARLVGCAPHVASRQTDGREDAHEPLYAPDAIMADGDTIDGPQFVLECVATPGHTGNHLSFALVAENALFSGDHVMAWSTSVIIPPDGAMSDYMASLEKLQHRRETIYWPGHGAPVQEPQAYVAALIRHRRGREASILAELSREGASIAELISAVYQGLDPALHGAARLSVLAHLEDLEKRGIVLREVGAQGVARYRLA